MLSGGARLIEPAAAGADPAQAAVLARQAGGMVGEPRGSSRFRTIRARPIARAIGSKLVAWADPLPLEDVKTIGHALECTVNDVLMSTVAGTLGAWSREQGHDIGAVTVRATLPVNLRERSRPSPSAMLASFSSRCRSAYAIPASALRNALDAVRTQGLDAAADDARTAGRPGPVARVAAGARDRALQPQGHRGRIERTRADGPLYLCGQRISECTAGSRRVDRSASG